jgi:hypothetical protein
MSDPLFIYPAWLKAKRQLTDALELNPKQEKILAEWFKSHIFEFAQEFTESREIVKRFQNDPKYTEYHDRKMLMGIAENIFAQGLFIKEITHPWTERVTRLRLLVCGVSPLGVGPAERKVEK